ncbi:MAG: hypothetical protein ACLU5J_03380 [Christensenellales bacterium]
MQAILELYYLSTEQIRLDIIVLLYIMNVKIISIHISHLKGIVNQIDNLNILSGIVIDTIK